MIFLIFIIYYLTVFFFPFEGFKILPSISSIYLFEVIFITVVSILVKLNISFKLKNIKKLLSKLFFTIILGGFSIGLIKFLDLETPFKYLDHYVVQLIILAPLIEELVYRHILFGLMKRKKIDKLNILFFNSLLFSFSHAIAFFSLPAMFYPFIFIQLLYTFILGWFMTKAKMDHESIIAPIGLHFVFNLLFLISLT